MLTRIFRRPKAEHLPRNPHIRKDIGLPLIVSHHAAILVGLGLGERR
jgi:hypothetical protein